MASPSTSIKPPIPCHVPVKGQPAWDLALLYPVQGNWTQEEYLDLTDDTNWLVEYTDGKIEVLRMPTIEHQLIVRFLMDVLRAFVDPRKLGMVLFAPTRVYVDPEKYREPDIVFNFTENHAKSGRRYYQSADLVMEVVSDDPESHMRDWEKKKADYAEGGVPEYWIIDPQQKLITVLALQEKVYVEHGVFREGQTATSKLLEGFTIDVSATFAAAKA